LRFFARPCLAGRPTAGSFFQHAFGVIAQGSHAHRIVGRDQNRQRIFHGGHPLVVGDGLLGPVDGRHMGAFGGVVARHMHLVSGQRIDDVGHALTRVGGVLGVWKAADQIAEGLKGLLGGFLIALGQVLAGDEGEKAQVVVEIHQPFEVQRIVQRRAGGVQLDEAVQCGDGLHFVACFVLGVGFFDLGLLRQQRAGRTAFELVKQADGLVPGTRIHFVACFFVDAISRPTCRHILGGAGAAGQDRCRQQQAGGKHR